MDSAWERSVPLIQVDRQTAEQIVREYDGGCSVRDLAPISIGCRNSNYIVTLNHGRMLLRVCPDKGKSFRKERMLCELLCPSVKMPAVYHISETNALGRVCILYEFIGGVSLMTMMEEQHKATKRIVEQAAEYAAHIHNHSENPGPEYHNLDLPPFDTWYDLFLANDNTVSRLGADLAGRVKKLMEDKKGYLRDIDNMQSLTHGDYRPANMLVGNDGLLYVVDWEFAGRGHVLADIGQFFRYSQLFDAELLSVFFRTYNNRSTAPLPGNWVDLIKLRDLINPLQMLSLDEDSPAKFHDLKEVVKNTLLYFNH